MRCKACNLKFKQRFIGHALCDDEACKSENEDARVAYAIEDARIKLEKQEKARLLQKKRDDAKRKRDFRNNDRTWLKKTALELAQEYGRLRDKKERGRFCCTCGKQFEEDEKCDGGHFLRKSVWLSIRFNTNQIHQQCVYCNRTLDGAEAAYRVFMVAKYGEEYVLKLQNSRHSQRKFSTEYLQRIIAIYRKKIKRLK